mmetsp:Transcript_143503/g.267448  ORF Transcript_143503/g.267448 Transcript_143503/m.267448 type:complete len:115 (-) Transcript_143503:31-375(-)
MGALLQERRVTGKLTGNTVEALVALGVMAKAALNTTATSGEVLRDMMAMATVLEAMAGIRMTCTATVTTPAMMPATTAPVKAATGSAAAPEGSRIARSAALRITSGIEVQGNGP